MALNASCSIKRRLANRCIVRFRRMLLNCYVPCLLALYRIRSTFLGAETVWPNQQSLTGNALIESFFFLRLCARPTVNPNGAIRTCSATPLPWNHW